MNSTNKTIIIVMIFVFVSKTKLKITIQTTLLTTLRTPPFQRNLN